MRVPRATYRLQLTPDFGFERAASVVAYLERLGVSDLYLSPVAQATKGSRHGYDVVDPTRASGELGGAQALRRLLEEARGRGMGVVLDIVPNHMAASPHNPWWWDVLENGPDSEHARAFDIDWNPPWSTLEGKLLLPIHGRPYVRALEAGEIGLAVEGERLVVRYYEHALPVRRGSYAAVLGRGGGDLAAGAAAVNADLPVLDALLAEQHYRLGFWQTAAEEINYRRFFDISGLVGLRTEDPGVFQASHALALGLVADGLVSGLRVDHVDGLRDPTGYLRRLREHAPDAYVVVEKILAEDEALPGDWPIQGTTGYEVMGDLNRVLVDADGLDTLGRAYAAWTGAGSDFDEVLYERKKQALDELFGAELRAAGWELGRLAREHMTGRDLTEWRLRDALGEVTACLPVYRTYTCGFEVAEPDRRVIESALADARARRPELDVAFDFLRDVLLLRLPEQAAGEQREAWLDFVLRWQQLTGPVMAKGGEDTAFYTYNRLVSLNEVGGEPGEGGLSVEAFHRRMAERARTWPHALSASATHDAKRGEDVRARIAVLSELADEWAERFARWREHNASARVRVGERFAPDANEEWLLYQTLIGVWPFDEADLTAFRERLAEYAVKAAREAKANTSWMAVDEDYENALVAFMNAVLDDDLFVAELLEVQRRAAWHGMLNSLAQLVLKATVPGAPDFYQGTELWSLVLVDPDNRRPVDYALRERLLAELERAWAADPAALARELLERWTDGRIKLHLTHALLTARAARPELFADGEYLPLRVVGRVGEREAADHVVAFARRREGEWAVTVVPRLTTRLAPAGQPPVGRVWRDATVLLPEGAPRRWRNALTDAAVEGLDAGKGPVALPLGSVLAWWPVAVLTRG